MEVNITGAVPTLAVAVNQLRFDCDAAPDVSPRERISTATFGAPLSP